MKPPEIGELLKALLGQPVAGPAPAFDSEVVLHQAAGVQLVDPRTAFDEAVEVMGILAGPSVANELPRKKLRSYPEWAALVRQASTASALPFCVGNFPQMIADITPLLGEADLGFLRPQAGDATPTNGVLEQGLAASAAGRHGEALFFAALLRLAKRFDDARQLLKKIRRSSPGFQNLLLNEEAALAWHAGEHERAAELWAEHPRQDNPAIQLNRGMAALFANERAGAAGFLRGAAAALPEGSPWRHLANLYLALAETAAA